MSACLVSFRLRLHLCVCASARVHLHVCVCVSAHICACICVRMYTRRTCVLPWMEDLRSASSTPVHMTSFRGPIAQTDVFWRFSSRSSAAVASRCSWARCTCCSGCTTGARGTGLTPTLAAALAAALLAGGAASDTCVGEFGTLCCFTNCACCASA